MEIEDIKPPHTKEGINIFKWVNEQWLDRATTIYDVKQEQKWKLIPLEKQAFAKQVYLQLYEGIIWCQ